MPRSVNPISDRSKRAALEKAAYFAIYERGFAAVTLADIAAQAGVSPGTLVYHFGSKSGLLASVMRRFIRTFAVATRRALRQATRPEDKLRAYVENQFYSLESTRRFYTVSLDFLAASTRDPALLELQQHFLVQTLALDLELARLSSEPEPQERAILLRALVEGLSMRLLADPAPELGDYRARCQRGLKALLSV